MSLDTKTYITVQDLLDFMQKTKADFQIPFFKIYNNGAGATVQVTDTTIVLTTTAGGTDTLTFADADKDTISELITAINALSKGWVVNQLCQNDQASTNLEVFPATACVGSANEIELTGYDLLYLEDTINRATDVIDKYCNRTFKSTTYTNEYYDGTGGKYLFLKNFPITVLTSVEYYDRISAQVTSELTEDTDYIAYYDEGMLYSNGWTSGRKNIRVTYTAGYSSADMPQAVVLACLKLCSTEISNRGREGLSSERIGNYSYTTATSKNILVMNYIPDDIIGLIEPFQKTEHI